MQLDETFFSRRPELCVRKSEATSVQRAIGFNKSKVDRFFDLMEKVCLNEKGERIIPYSNIYNVDESGFSWVHKPRKL